MERERQRVNELEALVGDRLGPDNEPVTVRALRAFDIGFPDCERLTLPGGAEEIPGRAIVPVEMLELEKVVLEAAVAPALGRRPDGCARRPARPFARGRPRLLVESRGRVGCPIRSPASAWRP
jgi:hypothetical protein